VLILHYLCENLVNSNDPPKDFFWLWHGNGGISGLVPLTKISHATRRKILAPSQTAVCIYEATTVPSWGARQTASSMLAPDEIRLDSQRACFKKKPSRSRHAVPIRHREPRSSPLDQGGGRVVSPARPRLLLVNRAYHWKPRHLAIQPILGEWLPMKAKATFCPASVAPRLKPASGSEGPRVAGCESLRHVLCESSGQRLSTRPDRTSRKRPNPYRFIARRM